MKLYYIAMRMITLYIPKIIIIIIIIIIIVIMRINI